MTTLPRRRVLGLVAGSAAAGLLPGCVSFKDEKRGLWNDGVLILGTGNTTGVFYQVGGGYADAISHQLKGYEVIVAPTTGSADNLLRLGTGDVQVALTFADVASDAVRGEGTFAGPPRRIRALAAIYLNYTHLVVTAASGVKKISDLKGKRISTGTPNSGTEFLALRLLRAAGLDPDNDISRQSLSLPATTAGLAAGTLDATFWSGGLPTVGITGLLDSSRGKVRFLPVDSLLPELERAYPDTYLQVSIPANVYGLPGEIATVAVNNLIVVDEKMPDQLAHDLTEIVFTRQKELAAAHPEWANVRRDTADRTGIVPLHPGARSYYEQ